MKNLIGKMMALGLCAGAITPVMADEEDTPLAKQMETTSDSLKLLRRADTFAEKAQLARDGQESVIKSLKFIPETFERVDDKAKVAMMTADYKRRLGLTYSKFAELEMAFLEEDEIKAEKIVDELKDLKKDGHKKYVDDN